jgi:uncharacterized protein (DUF433 family)
MSINLSENEIDDLVIAQAEDESAWDEPIQVKREKIFPLFLSESEEIVSKKEVLDGTPVFRGTEVPVSVLIDNLEEGVSLDDFLGSFPTVKRNQAIQVLEYFKKSLIQFKEVA